MKRTTLFLLLLSMCSWALKANTYVESSVLKSGRIIKLQVSETGLYGLSYEQIRDMGLRPDSVRILGYGGNLISQDVTQPRLDDVPSLPFYMQLGADSVFSAGDYIIFFAKGPVGWSWQSSSNSFLHTRNHYADYGCYFISDQAGEQILLSVGDTLDPMLPYEAYSYTALQLHEVDQYNMIDTENGHEGGGREWYGEKFTQTAKTLTIPFQFEDVDTTTNLLCRVEVVASASEVTTMKTTVAGKTITSRMEAIAVSDFYTKATSKTSTGKTHPVDNNIPVKMEYTTTLNSATAYLNYIEMQVPCKMHLRGSHLVIRNTEHVGYNMPTRYHLTGANTYTQIWNMTDPSAAYIVPATLSNDTLCWVGSNSTVQCFVAINTQAKNWKSPASRGVISNQDIHARIRGKQHIIIAPEEFLTAAERLKQVHEQYSTDKWAVVSDQEVYNEFSSGTPDASAYRWMMKYLYDSFAGTNKAPKTLLLFGDGSFDNRQILKSSAVPYLLTYQATNSLVETKAYATDDYFGWLDDKGGMYGSTWDDKRARMQIGVGRLPVRSADEAEAMVTKISNYLADHTAGNWKQQLCFLADDGDAGIHTECTDTAAKRVANTAPDYICNKIYLDSYVQETSASGESYPIAYNTFCNLLQTGVMLMDYSGHGSANNICSEMFLTRAQVESMTNTNLGIWALATCNFAHFDQTAQSTAEVAVLNPVGGAIAVVSADRTVYASENEILNKFFCENLFKHTDPFTYTNTIGEALRLAKNQNGDNMNKLPFLLLGDPSIKLNHPCQYQVRVSTMPDTLHALDLVVIKGYISNGDTLSKRRDTVDFTGKLTITVYDKIQTIATRDNDQQDESKKKIMYFQDYPNKLFMGEADVTDGLFTIEFRIPKDIRYNLGLGRITMYAIGMDAHGRAEAMGHSEQFFVGGSSPWIIDDTQGPNMHIYLNSPFFNDGDHVNTTPHFYAELSDENGINTIGSGIGHDLQLTLDNSPKQTYILNNYYTADNNSYTSGLVSYILPQLEDGSHSLSFRAWDLLNNATTQTIGFTVDSQQGPVVQSVVVYPNPVSRFGTIYMDLTSDRPDDLLDMRISFYDLSGRKIWSSYIAQCGNNIALDLSQAGLSPGSYIYQFTIQTSTQESRKYNGRLIVY